MKMVLVAAALSLAGAGGAFAQSQAGGQTAVAPPTTETGAAGTVAAELHDTQLGPGETAVIANTPPNGPPATYPVCTSDVQDRCIAQPGSFRRSQAQALNTGAPPATTR